MEGEGVRWRERGREWWRCRVREVEGVGEVEGEVEGEGDGGRGGWRERWR